MENPNDPHNIIGMADILADDEEDLDIDDIEKSIISGITLKKDDKPVDIAKEYDAELEQLGKQFNIGSFNSKVPMLNDDDEDVSSWAPFKSSDVPDKTAAEDDDEPSQEQAAPQFSQHSSWSATRPLDSQLNQMTNEERKQRHINNVLGRMDKDEDTVFINEEDEEDEMAKIMEQIDQLKTTLESEGVDLSRIPETGAHTTKKEAKAVLRVLQIKNDRLRYCDMFEEGILACAYGLESMFDGKKVWFGSQIDLTGWSDTVKVKLRRMRYDTSTFVSEIVKGYQISSGWRILFELLPSLFLYSRDRRIRANDNLISDDKYKTAINELNN